MKDIASILSKVDAEEMLTKEDAVTLLNIDNQSKVFYELIAKANELSSLVPGSVDCGRIA